MKILIVGAGALGSYFAAQLYKSGEDVLLYHHRQEQADLLAKQGITIVEPDGSQSNFVIPIFSDMAAVPAVDLVILLVKAYDIKAAAEDLQKLKNHTYDILSLQNGLGSTEVLLDLFPGEQLFGGVVYQGAYQISPGEIMHTGGIGRIYMAPLCEKSLPKAEAYADILTKSNLPTEAMATKELDKIRWGKLLVNTAISSVATLHGVENGVTAENEHLRREMLAITKEGVAVGQAMGVELEFDVVWDSIIDTAHKTAANRCSMLCDADQGKRMEIEAIPGSIARLGQEKGIKTPATDEVIRRIKERYMS